jgi:hypothetical protein
LPFWGRRTKGKITGRAGPMAPGEPSNSEP